MIVIGTSAGGVEALQTLLSHLPDNLTTPMAVVMHLPEHSDIQFSKFINAGSYQVIEAQDKMEVTERTITFAPAGYHLLIEKGQTYSLSQDEPVYFSRPSIDLLFESAARVFRRALTGILLTGASQDGAKGLSSIRKHGGYTIVQDPKTAQVSTMPQAALDLFQPNAILPLQQIREFLLQRDERSFAWKI